MKRILLFSIICVLGFGITGCESHMRSESALLGADGKTISNICVGGTNKTAALQSAEAVLAKFNFHIHKLDNESGYLVSRPLPAAQGFEFWRKDNIGKYSAAEASLHTIRRTVEINVTEKAQQLCLACNVKVERLSLSDYKDQSRTVKYDRYSEGKMNFGSQELKLDAEYKTWIDLGNDDKLAAVILRQIEKQLISKMK